MELFNQATPWRSARRRSAKTSPSLQGSLWLLALCLNGACRAALSPSPPAHANTPVMLRDAAVTPEVSAPLREPAAPPSAAPPLPPSPTPDTHGPVVERFRTWELPELLRAMRARSVVRMRHRFNASHPVFELELRDGLRVSFRAATRDRPELFRNDLAGYGLARLLGISERVPPATWRAVPMDLLETAPADRLRHLHGSQASLAYGAVMFWMPTLHAADVLSPPLLHTWPLWLSQQHPLDNATPARAEELSTLLVFDALQRNSDRWHSANLRTDERGVVVYRDNNEAWRSGREGEPMMRLRHAERFSRALVEALRRADANALREVLSSERPLGEPVLREVDLARYESRRRRVLAYIDALIAEYGAPRVLCWP